MFTAEVNAALMHEPTKVEKRPDGMSYLSGHYVFSRANEVFGLDGWSYSAGQVDVLPNGVVRCAVTVTAGGRSVTDYGTGTASPDRPQSYETAIKDAVTDGVKRGLRSFGVTFGLSLYDKESELHAQAVPSGGRSNGSNYGGQRTAAPSGGGSTAPWPRDVPQDKIPDSPVCEYSGEPFTGFVSSTGKSYDPRTEAAWTFKDCGALVKKRYRAQWQEAQADSMGGMDF